MSQADILEVLEKHKKPLTRTEIALELNMRLDHASHIIKRLIEKNELKFKELDRNQAKELFGDKAPFRRLRIYYV